MPWRAITENDVLATLTESEREAVASTDLGITQTDPIGAVTRTATMEARGRIAAFRGNALADGETVPDTIIHHVVAIIRWRLLSRLPVSMLATDARRQEYDEAVRFLRDVAAGQVSIERPETTDDEPRQRMRPSVSGREKQFSRANQDGI